MYEIFSCYQISFEEICHALVLRPISCKDLFCLLGVLVSLQSHEQSLVYQLHVSGQASAKTCCCTRSGHDSKLCSLLSRSAMWYALVIFRRVQAPRFCLEIRGPLVDFTVWSSPTVFSHPTLAHQSGFPQHLML